MNRPDPTNAARQRRTVARKIASGQVRVTVWVPVTAEQAVRDYDAALREEKPPKIQEPLDFPRKMS